MLLSRHCDLILPLLLLLLLLTPSPLVRFVINPSWDDNLEELAQQRTEVEQSIMAEFKRAQSLASTMDIKCENDARRGVVMRTARSNDKKLRKLMG